MPMNTINVDTGFSDLWLERLQITMSQVYMLDKSFAAEKQQAFEDCMHAIMRTSNALVSALLCSQMWEVLPVGSLVSRGRLIEKITMSYIAKEKHPYVVFITMPIDVPTTDCILQFKKLGAELHFETPPRPMGLIRVQSYAL